jgi:periplasmic divalent cation tolerance protein
MQYGVVLVTASSRAEAEAIAQTLIAAKLAACINLFPVYSISTWQGKLEQGEEWQLVIKTDLAKFSDLAAKVQEVHSYEVPEIIALPIALGAQPYLSWIGEQTGA